MDSSITSNSTPRRKAVLISSMKPATGNAVTSERFIHYLSRADFHVTPLDAGEATVDGVAVACRGADLIVAVHAFRAGRLLPFHSPMPPLIVVLGGTDVNQAAAWEADPESRIVFRKVFARAFRVVSFSADMLEKYVLFCGRLGLDVLDETCRDRLPREYDGSAPRPVLIPQGVEADIAVKRDLAAADVEQARGLRAKLGIPPTDGVLLLVAGLRKVKDPLLLVQAVAAHNASDRSCPLHLVILGPLLDPAFAPLVVSATGCHPDLLTTAQACTDLTDAGGAVRAGAYSTSVDAPPLEQHKEMGVFAGALLTSQSSPASQFGGRGGTWYHPPVPRTQLLEWLCIEARTLVQHRTTTEGEPRGTVLGLTVLVNSSESEGQCNALLEAMQAGIPILARDNAGNSRIIQHGITGWLWHDPHDCIRLARELCLCAPSNSGSRVRPCLRHSRSSIDACTQPSYSCSAQCFCEIGEHDIGICGTHVDQPSLATQCVWRRAREVTKNVTDTAAEYVRSHHSHESEAAAWRALLEDSTSSTT